MNCGLGETDPATRPGYDEAVVPFISSASIACGFQADDLLTLYRTMPPAIRHGVSIVAHPWYPDCQTSGGYARIANVITVDLTLLAQMRSGDKILFKETLLDFAQ
ncbi:MAG: LamB/YcsF family protein [Bacteroidales bacterium]